MEKTIFRTMPSEGVEGDQLKPKEVQFTRSNPANFYNQNLALNQLNISKKQIIAKPTYLHGP